MELNKKEEKREERTVVEGRVKMSMKKKKVAAFDQQHQGQLRLEFLQL